MNESIWKDVVSVAHKKTTFALGVEELLSITKEELDERLEKLWGIPITDITYSARGADLSGDVLVVAEFQEVFW